MKGSGKMAKHIVMCRVCKKCFDTEMLAPDQWIMPSKNFYYHTQCYQDWKDVSQANKSDDDWALLIYDFLVRDLKVSYNYHMCEAQRKKFLKENKFTNKGIYFTLKYFYEIKHNSWDKGNGGLGIVPYVYKEATEYWTDQEWKKRGFMKAIEEQIFERSHRPVKKITKPTIQKPKIKYNLDDIGAEDDS